MRRPEAVEIRSFASRDRSILIRAIADLQDSEVALHDTRLPGATIAAAYLDELLGNVATRHGAIFTAWAKQDFAGFVACMVVEDDQICETPDSGRHGYVSDIFVVPSHRATGLAQRLLAGAERHLSTTGVTRLRISVLAANRIARHAYEKYGFAPYEVVYEKRIG